MRFVAANENYEREISIKSDMVARHLTSNEHTVGKRIDFGNVNPRYSSKTLCTMGVRNFCKAFDPLIVVMSFMDDH